MRLSVRQLWTTLAAVFVAGVTVPIAAQVATPAPVTATRNPLTGDPKAITQGAVLFRQECVFCHGVSGRGGMRGPDLTTGSWTHGGSDAELAATIASGVPGTAMPPNKLTEEEIWQIVTYLRTVQQPVAPPTGDARRGETLFFGATRCSTCHIVNGRGGRLGPELSTVGSARVPRVHHRVHPRAGQAPEREPRVRLRRDAEVRRGDPGHGRRRDNRRRADERRHLHRAGDGHERAYLQPRQEVAESFPAREPVADARLRPEPVERRGPRRSRRVSANTARRIVREEGRIA